MFREFEHISTISDGDLRTPEDESAVGLGLALVARIVKVGRESFCSPTGVLKYFVMPELQRTTPGRIESWKRIEIHFCAPLPVRRLFLSSLRLLTLDCSLPSTTTSTTRSRLISREPSETKSVSSPTPLSAVQLPSSPLPNSNPLERSGIDQILESLLDSGSQAFSTRDQSTSGASSTGSPMVGLPFNRIQPNGVKSLPVTLAPTRAVSRGPLSSPLRKTTSNGVLGGTTLGVEALKLFDADSAASVAHFSISFFADFSRRIQGGR